MIHLLNSSFPSVYSETSSLTYTINKCSSEVCAVRLDFETFTTLGPADTVETNGGACQDSFVVRGTGSGLTTPVICGSNAGQHSKFQKFLGLMNKKQSTNHFKQILKQSCFQFYIPTRKFGL